MTKDEENEARPRGSVSIGGVELHYALEHRKLLKEAKQVVLDAWGLRPFDRCIVPGSKRTKTAISLAQLAIEALDEDGMLRTAWSVGYETPSMHGLSTTGTYVGLVCECGHLPVFHFGENERCQAVDAAGSADAIACECKSFRVGRTDNDAVLTPVNDAILTPMNDAVPRA